MSTAILPPSHQAQTGSPEASPFVTMTPFHRFALVALVAASLAVVGVLQRLQPASVAGMPWVFLALGLNGVLLLLPVLFYRPGFGWFHPLVFAVFWGLFNHLRRFDLYTTGLSWHEALPGWSADQLTGLLVKDLVLQAAGLAALYAGYAVGPSIKLPPIQFQQPAYLGRKTAVTVAFAAGLFAVYLQSRGGLINHILSWGGGRNQALAGAFYWQFLIQLGLIACLCWLTLDHRSTANPLFWGCTLTSLMMVFLMGGSRSSVVYFMIMGLLAWLLREQKIAILRIVAIALVGLLALGVLGNLRNSTFSGSIDWNALWGRPSISTTTEASALSSSLKEISQRSSVYAGEFPILGLVPHQVDYLGGSSYMAVLTLPVPRAFWPEKPGLIAGLVGQTFFNSDVGMPPGPIGEAYWNFGVPGVLLVFAVFGAFQKLLAQTFTLYHRQAGAIVPYVITLFLFSEPTGLATIAWLMMLVPTLGFMTAVGAMRLGEAHLHRGQPPNPTALPPPGAGLGM